MKIRLGYVAMCETLNESASHNITYKSYVKSNKNNELINEIVRKNISSLSLILDFNIKNNVHFYRMTSKLIPLATHNDVKYDYYVFSKELKELGDKIKENNMRVDCHPDQFCVLNSTNKNVINNTINILKYHCNILKMMGLIPQLVLHVGSSNFGKEASIKRFINTFNKLPDELKKSILIENDDKTYDVIDVINLCEKIKRPMVLDFHHHICNNKENIDLMDYMTRIFSTWDNVPKIHFSSPKSKKKSEVRCHSDYINVFKFIEFIDLLKHFDKDVDIMLECKKKDAALFKLVRELKLYSKYKFIDETSFIV